MSEIEIRKIHENETIYWIYGSFFLLFGILENITGNYKIAAISTFIFIVARPSTTKYMETKLKIKIPRIFILCNLFSLTAALFFPIEGIIFSLVMILIFLLDLLRKPKNNLNLVECPSEDSTLSNKSKVSAPYDPTWSLIKKIVYFSLFLFFSRSALSAVDAGERWGGAVFLFFTVFFLAKLFSQIHLDSRAKADLVDKAQVNNFIDKSKANTPYDPTWSLIKKIVYFILFLFFLHLDITVLADRGLWWRVVFFLLTIFFFVKLFAQIGTDSRTRAALVDKTQVSTLVNQSEVSTLIDKSQEIGTDSHTQVAPEDKSQVSTLVNQSEASTLTDQSQASVLVNESQEHILWASQANTSANKIISKYIENPKIASVIPDLSTVDEMEGEVFEDYVMNIYESLGYSAEKTPKTGDQGADLILSKDGEKTAVQVKRYSRKVSNRAIQEVVGSLGFYGCSKGVVVTNSYFTTSAKTLAESNDVDLIDRDELEELVNQANSIRLVQ